MTITLEPVPPEYYQQPSTEANTEINSRSGRLPAGFVISVFPRNLQTRLDNKEPCQKSSKDRHRNLPSTS
ncbi:hypothetical protein QQF64_019886 [Cirrhinus molitorella]|uniref:Uncharacterized protein n=1 Tax=Cirrhinus molitorella TaxID=172907 RepID=A0ABR3LI48_9TELE